MIDSPFTAIGDEPVEARIVAWVLGEASAFEAAELERLCEERPELLVFRRRMRALHGLLTEAEAAQPDDGWKLPAEKRKVLDEIFGEVKAESPDQVVEKRIKHSERRALLAIAACVMISFIVLGFLPKKYSAEAIVEVKPRGGMSPLGASSADASGPRMMTPQFFGTEFEKIKSRNSLEKVVENLDLTKRWNVDKETALARLKDSIETKNIRGTDLISIEAHDADPEQAKEIAEQVTNRYQEYRNEIEMRDTNQELARLRKAVQNQEDKVEERRKVLSTIARTKGIIHRGDDSVDNRSAETKQNEDREEAIKRGLDAQDYADAKRDFEDDQELLQTMKLKLIGEDTSSAMAGESVELHQGPVVSRKFGNPVEAAASGFKKLLAKEEPSSAAPPAMASYAAKESSPSMPESALAQNAPATAGEKAPSPMADMPIIETRSMALEVNGGSEVSAVSGALAASAPQEPMAKGKAFGGGAGGGATETTMEQKGGKPKDAVETESALDSDSTTDGSLSFAGKVDDLRRSLSNAEGNYNLGQYDQAKTEYENALKKDPYNAAARRGLDRIESAKTDYYRAAYDHTRAELLAQVDKSWELAVPAEGENKDRAGQEGVMTGTSVMPSLTKGSLGIAPSDGGNDLAKQFDQLRDTPVSSMDITKILGEFRMSAGITRSISGYAQDMERDRAMLSPEMQSFNMKAAELSYQLSSSTSSDESQVDLSVDPSSPPPAFDGFANFGRSISGLESNLPAPRGMIVDPELGFMTKVQAPEKPNGPPTPAATPVSPATATAWMSLDEGMKANRSATDQKEVSKRQLALPKPPLTDLMQEIAASEEPYSTFSLNISDASFQVAQAALAKGERPDPAGIKVEQFYNAVDYGDPAPSAGEPVALAIEQSAHPVIPGRSLVRVALKTAAAGRSASQPLRLTLLVDQSGSMVREDRRAAMEKALAGLGGLLTDKDLVTVIGFCRTPRLLADGLQGDKAGKLADMVNQTASEGGTNLEQAIQLAGQLADRHKLAAAQNRIVLFTDGAANLGNADPARLAEKVKVLRQQGIAFDIAGIAADGLNDELLGELARNGNGRYYVVGKGGEDNLAKQLAGAFRPAAENVKVQVRFNPERVGRYKLIGFEKDRLKTEDFRNDAVDAAELAAEEAGVAIYQVETLPDGKGELGEVSVRFRDAASAGMVERSWTIPHDGNAAAFDRASPSMQLATLAMFAAEKLKGGPLADAIDFNQLAEPRANVKRFYGNSGRVGEVLNMVDALK